MADSLVVSPPDFLVDLMGDVVGKNLECYRTSKHQCTLQISFGVPSRETDAGLFLAPKTRYGIRHSRLHWEFYRHDRSFFGHAWDDNLDDMPGPLCTFEEWARREVRDLMWNRLYQLTIQMLEGLHPQLGKKKKQELIERCKQILRCAEKHGLDIRAFAPAVECIELTLTASCRELHTVETEKLKRHVKNIDGKLREGNTLFPKVIRQNGLVSMMPEGLYNEITPVLMKRIKSETRQFLKEMSHKPSSQSFEAFKQGAESCEVIFNIEICKLMEEDAKRRKDEELISPEVRSVLNLTEEYIELRRDFWNYWPKPEGAHERGKRMVELETFINIFWKEWAESHEEISVEPSQSGPPIPTPGSTRMMALNRIIREGRFLSVGSQVYVGWLRNIERWDDAVAFVMNQTQDLEMSALRHQSHSGGFESFLCNGLGCFVDSKQDEHPPLGVQIIERLETIMTFESGCLLYQFTCVFARAGLTERALDYAEKAVFAGERFSTMAKDSDLKSLLNEPRFKALKEVDLLSAA